MSFAVIDACIQAQKYYMIICDVAPMIMYMRMLGSWIVMGGLIAIIYLYVCLSLSHCLYVFTIPALPTDTIMSLEM